MAQLLQEVHCEVLGMEEDGEAWLLWATCSSGLEGQVEWGEVRCDNCGVRGLDVNSCYLSYSFDEKVEQEAVEKEFGLFQYDTILAVVLVGVLVLLGYLVNMEVKKEAKVVRVEQQDLQEVEKQEVKMDNKKEMDLGLTNREGRQARKFQQGHSQLKKSKKNKL